MIPAIKTKLFGTAVLGIVVLGAGATTFSITQAQLIAQNGSLSVNGTVSVVNTTNNTITITTDDASPITFRATPSTKFDPNSITGLGGISVGDDVLIAGNIITNNGKQYIATSIKEVGTGPGYGKDTNRLFVETGKVNFIDLKDGNFTIQFGTTYANFEVHITTQFTGKTFKQLKLGDTVTVNGEDTGTYFLANRVTDQDSSHGNH